MQTTEKITLTFHLHGPLRKIGDKIPLQFPQGISTAEALANFFTHYPKFADWQNVTRCAMDMEYLSTNHQFETNVEIHLIPPVSGG
ncbi:MAG: MoaD/ThiS family protein [Verrucomicrobiae bacterium]|nr:MoaD/ThiS family protein [Verrucomicrobiae bacterium]